MPRKIVILTQGTLGDVRPFTAFGLALQNAGYSVLLGAPENYVSWIERQGLPAVRCGGDFRALMENEEIIEFLNRTNLGQILGHHRVGNGPFRPMKEKSIKDAMEITADADLILFHPMLEFACDVAEARRIPAIQLTLAPLTPTREFPICLAPRTDYPPWFNRLSYNVLYMHRFAVSNFANDQREKLGLPRLSRFVYPYNVNGRPVPTIVAMSPATLKRPDDWADNVHITGYWFFDGPEDDDWEPPPELDRFINDGEPPIYIGFGSMPSKDAEERTKMVVRACTAAGKRAILAKGWGGVTLNGSALPADRFHVLDSAPHKKLFPLMSAVVHHGGAGTTAAGFRAGSPTLVCPFAMDQPFWGWRVHALGVGPEPLPTSIWSDETLAASLKDVSENPRYRARSREIASSIAAEDGLKSAVAVVEREFGLP